MARTTSQSRRQSPVPFIIPDGLSAKKIEFEPAEDNKERDHRLRKDWWSFFVNDVLASIVAFAVLLTLVVFSFATLIRASSTPDDRRFATSMLTAVGPAVAGVVFGKGKN